MPSSHFAFSNSSVITLFMTYNNLVSEWGSCSFFRTPLILDQHKKSIFLASRFNFVFFNSQGYSNLSICEIQSFQIHLKTQHRTALPLLPPQSELGRGHMITFVCVCGCVRLYTGCLKNSSMDYDTFFWRGSPRFCGGSICLWLLFHRYFYFM